MKGKEPPSEDKMTEKTAETRDQLDQHDVLQGENPYVTKEEKLKIQYVNTQIAKSVLQQKTQYQIRALFAKSWNTQSRQLMTNVLQITVPIMCLLIMMFLSEAVVQSSQVFANKEIAVPIPHYYNLPLKALSSLGTLFNVTSCDEWYMYSFNKSTTSQEDRDYFGFNEGKDMWKPSSSGMLQSGKNILDTPCKQINRSVPYFKIFEESNYGGKTMNQHTWKVLDSLAENYLDTANKNQEIGGLEEVPDGMIEISKANKENLAYRVQMNDFSIFQYHRNNGVSKIGIIQPGTQRVRTNSSEPDFLADNGNTTYLLRPTEGAVALTDRLDQAYMRSIFPDTFIVAGQQFMPFKPQTKKEAMKIINSFGAVIFPVALAMSMPAFLYSIVLEKENRLLENMKINGLQMVNYWIVGFFFNMGCQMVIIMSYLLFGKFVSDISFFTDTNFMIVLLAYTAWGMCSVSIAFLLSCFLNKANSAVSIGYVFSIIMVLGSSTAMTCGGLYYYPQEHKPRMYKKYYWAPHLVYTRIFYILTEECGWKSCLSKWKMVPDEVFELITVLFIESIVILILSIYLNEVVPQEYGVSKHPLFLIEPFIINYFPSLHPKIFRDNSDLISYKDESELQDEDEDVKEERKTVYQLDMDELENYPLVVQDVRKVYPGIHKPIIANKNITLHIRTGELFGLLGPNGAGKTTLIQQLTGFYKPTRGNAWIGGFDIKTQLDIVRLQIGVCPQFDVLWDIMTVEEHLEFYARLKGVHLDELDELVTRSLTEMQLLPQRHEFPPSLPLGMRRRLSIAICLVSRPKIIFLDEPTTGLDPDTRRGLWNILQELKKEKNRAIVLTTHSMEEADVLCNRIGIVNKGVLRCIGSQSRLKRLYGGGYHLYINCYNQKFLNTKLSGENENERGIHVQLDSFISRLLPMAKKLRQFNGQFVYQVPLENFDAEDIFNQIEGSKAKLKIVDWGISQCSLDDVFSQICELK